METETLALRIGAALLAGAIIGLDRELHDKPAGMRTHAMVSVGAALVVLSMAGMAGQDDAMSRVIQGIITGIGFIGGGVILKLESEERVKGLTTAATIWVAAAFGIAAGAGLFKLLALGVVATLLLLTAGNWVEDFFKRHAERRDRGGK